jgi:hypothetical protein
LRSSIVAFFVFHLEGTSDKEPLTKLHQQSKLRKLLQQKILFSTPNAATKLCNLFQGCHQTSLLSSTGERLKP